LAIEPGVDGGGGFEGGDGDEDASPGVDEGDSELDSEFSVGSSVSDESSSSCAGGVSSCGCLELTHRGAFTTFPLLTRRANELENSRGRA
jgi:hypothetical protein